MAVSRAHAHPGSKVPPADLDEAAARIAAMRPALQRRVWPPMTYMLIPSVLDAADRLLAWLETRSDDDAERARTLHTELSTLRRDFRREA